VGKDDAGGTREIPPGPGWLLGPCATTGFEGKHLTAFSVSICTSD